MGKIKKTGITGIILAIIIAATSYFGIDLTEKAQSCVVEIVDLLEETLSQDLPVIKEEVSE